MTWTWMGSAEHFAVQEAWGKSSMTNPHFRFNQVRQTLSSWEKLIHELVQELKEETKQGSEVFFSHLHIRSACFQLTHLCMSKHECDCDLQRWAHWGRDCVTIMIYDTSCKEEIRWYYTNNACWLGMWHWHWLTRCGLIVTCHHYRIPKEYDVRCMRDEMRYMRDQDERWHEMHERWDEGKRWENNVRWEKEMRGEIWEMRWDEMHERTRWENEKRWENEMRSRSNEMRLNEMRSDAMRCNIIQWDAMKWYVNTIRYNCNSMRCNYNVMRYNAMARRRDNCSPWTRNNQPFCLVSRTIKDQSG